MAAFNLTSNHTEESLPLKKTDIDITPFVFGLFIAFMTVILNGFLLVVLAKERKSFMHMRVTYYIINLGIADFLTGAIILFLVITRLFQIPLSSTSEEILVIFNWITMQCSFYTLVLMSVDRLVIVLYSMSWSGILTVRRTIISTAIVWVLSVTGGIIMHFYQVETRLAILGIVQLSILVFIVNSLFIYPVLRKREKGRFVTKVSASQTVYSERVLYPLPYDNMSRVVMILIVVLMITQLPFVICMEMRLIKRLCGDGVLEFARTKLFTIIYLYAQSFACLNFAINPVVYAWRIKKYREAFANCLCW
ncbi:adrenocorticotropic hormone receptor-like [Dendronephthya gigantea]|uniref:adrenocorticotropic hormone receptor-like n=1 Tax=Dendronephthya gigantea TaxID=151771 RepID=UPI00106C21EB|nr:adrenocorticotropic hormone receptor-like [Dendronephthya gigantea]XP_028400118.1 adrenocorticotropic hormone receptor-like [Dendronephthya gigantea]